MPCGRRHPVRRGDGRDPARGSGGDSLWQVWPRPQGLVQMGAVPSAVQTASRLWGHCAAPGLGEAWV